MGIRWWTAIGTDSRLGGHVASPLTPLPLADTWQIRTVDEAAALGGLLELAHDQNGCRFLQDQLDLRVKAHIDLIFDAVCIDVVPLSMDPFGNYLIQKLVQYGTVEQRVALVGGAASSLISIALNVHGTRVVQKMIEVADTDAMLDTLIGAMEVRHYGPARTLPARVTVTCVHYGPARTLPALVTVTCVHCG